MGLFSYLLAVVPRAGSASLFNMSVSGLTVSTLCFSVLSQWPIAGSASWWLMCCQFTLTTQIISLEMLIFPQASATIQHFCLWVESHKHLPIYIRKNTQILWLSLQCEMPQCFSHMTLVMYSPQMNFILFICIIRILRQKINCPDIGRNDSNQYSWV